MKAVVSGAAGFIGSHLVDALLDRGYRVTGIDRQSRSAFPGYRHAVLDLADHPTHTGLVDILGDADIVFHLAGRPGVRGSGPVVDETRRRDNVVATRHVLSATPTDTPVVATSSSSVYGGCVMGSGGPLASKEDDPLRPRGGYARSKLTMEHLCESRRAQGGVAAVARPFTVAGEGQRTDMAFSMWLEAARRGEPIRIFGSEARSRDITDVRHVVEGVIRAGERRVNTTVNLGTGVGHRLIDMVRSLLAAADLDTEIVRQPVSADEVDATLADTSRCQAVLGFVPETDLNRLLRRQVEATIPRPVMVAT